MSYLLKHHHITNGRLHNRPSLTIERMLNVHIELCSGARLIRIKRSVAERLPYAVIYYVLTAGRLDNRGERYNRDFIMIPIWKREPKVDRLERATRAVVDPGVSF